MQTYDANALKNPDRLAYLYNLSLLDTGSEASFDRLTSLASRILRVPVSLVSLVDADRQYFKSFVGLAEPWVSQRETPLSHSFCQYTVLSGEPLIIEDARDNPLVKNNLAIPDLDVIGYAGIPLTTSEGYTLGSLCVMDPQPHAWTDDEIGILQDLALAVLSEIELRHEVKLRERIEAELSNQIYLLSTVLDVNAEISHTLNVDTVLGMALDAALRLSQADSGYIGLLDGSTLRLAQSIGAYSEAEINTYIQSESSIVSRVMRHRVAELISDVFADPDYVPLIDTTRSKIVIPLISRDNLVGVLNLETHDSTLFGDDIFRFLILLMSRVAVAVDNARLYQGSQSHLSDLQATHDKLSQLEQLKTDMIRIAAHDLRNPLGVIVGYVHLVRKLLGAGAPEDVLHYLGMVDGAAQKMEHITRDILSLQRIETVAQGGLERIDLRDFVQMVYHEHADSAAARGQRLTCVVPEAAVVVSGDSAYLTEVVTNLVGNAIKYTPDNGSIDVTLCVEDGRAVFEVQDTGFGIPAEHQARLFKPFARIRTDETENIDGTGLGLYLVKSVVERHGGTMRFSSVYGEGSTFGFEIPLAGAVED